MCSSALETVPGGGIQQKSNGEEFNPQEHAKKIAVHYVETGEDLIGHTKEFVFGNNCACEPMQDRGDVGR